MRSPNRQLNIPVVKGLFMFVTAWALGLGTALSGIGPQVAAAPAIDFLLGFKEERTKGTAMLFALAAAIGAVTGGLVGGIPFSGANTGTIVLLFFGATIGALLTAKTAQNPRLRLAQRAGQSLGVLIGVYMVGQGLRHRIGGPVSLDIGVLNHYPGLVALLIGITTGAASHILQVASGVFLVPALVLVAGAPISQAVLSSLAVIALAALLPTLGYSAQQAIDRQIGRWMTAGGVLGGFLGGYVLGRLTSGTLELASPLPFILFGLIAMFLSAWRIWKMT